MLVSLGTSRIRKLLQARNKITQRGAKLGIDFDAQLVKLWAAADWDQDLQVSSCGLHADEREDLLHCW